MKTELLKAIITDLQLAGIHDIPSNDFMDQEKINSQELVNAIFNQSADTNIDSPLNNEEFNEDSIASEMSELFAALGANRNTSAETLETIQAKAPTVKKTAKIEKTIIDPRNRPKTMDSLSISADSFTKQAKPIAKVDFKPENYISSKFIDDAKMVLILPYKNENELKSKADFNLLENILKAAKVNFSQTSRIFINDSFKKATQGIEKEEQKLAQALENELKLSKQTIILSFGQDCLDLASPSKVTIRQAATKALDVAESKKLLANYSLSAMVNTPKYKSTTWANLLMINKI